MKREITLQNRRKRILRSVLILLSALVVMTAAFVFYCADYYHMGEMAEQILQTKTLQIKDEEIDLLAENSEIGFIFYPGAKVEYTAYLPLLEKLRDKNVSCYLVEMPFNLAFFGSNKAQKIIEEHREITHWYIGGHSLGGAFASTFAGKHVDEIEGLILLGAYPTSAYPSDQTMILYGSEDFVLNRSKIDENLVEKTYVLEGGNHAQFGDYGKQAKDGEASISMEEQINQTTDYMIDFIDNVE